MFTYRMWRVYMDDPFLKFSLTDLICGNLLILCTIPALILDLFFIIPEIIIYRKESYERTRKSKRSDRAAK